MKIRVKMKVIAGAPTPPRGGRQFFQLLAESATVAVKERIKDGFTLDGDAMLTGAGEPGGTGRYTEAYEDWKAEGQFRKKGYVTTKKTERREGYSVTTEKTERREGYRISKEKLSRQRASLYSPGSRFRLSGRMLDAFGVIEVDEKHSKVGFPDEEVAARAHGNDQRRPTFALTKEETDKLVDYAVEQIIKTEERR